jgi:nucleoside phosphorylase
VLTNQLHLEKSQMTQQSPLLTIMVALNCEAKPWVDFYRLKKSVDRPFGVYTKPGLDIEIVITGIGASAMSTAVGWIAGRAGSRKRVWLNLGIAGHLDRSIGESVRVHSYIDAADLRHNFSPLVAKWSGDSDALMSVNAPTDSYPDAAMVDMEGLAYYRSASMFSSPELVESIKVISDNQEHTVENLNAAKITQLMQTHVSMINSFTDSLRVLVKPSNIAVIELPLEGVRRTHSQQLQLDRLLEKAAALRLNQVVSDLVLLETSEFVDVLNKLTKLIEGCAPPLKRIEGNQAASTKAEPEANHGCCNLY